ncbi:MAG: hypothetical protein HUK25_01935 [Treponema sp.]|nr:hypothetical protein [Treponema sp.]
MKTAKKIFSVLFFSMILNLIFPAMLFAETDSAASEIVESDVENESEVIQENEAEPVTEPVESSVNVGTSKSSGSSIKIQGSYEDQLFAGFLGIAAILSFLNILGSSYSDYPYSDGKFVHINFDGINMDNKSWWYTMGGSFDYLYKMPKYAGIDLGPKAYGGEAYMQGQFFKFVGPQVNYSILPVEGNYQHLLQAGIRFAIFQTTPFSLGWFCQYANFMGPSSQNGVTLGFDVWSLPVKPVSIKFSCSAIYYDAYKMDIYKGQLGFFINRMEVFAGAKYFTIRRKNRDEVFSRNFVFYAGFGIYF